MAALTIDGIGVDFGGFKAVDNFSMTVEEGELRVLLGANGAGKTTLMDLISGKTKSTEGRILLHDRDITNWQEHKIAREGVGRKFQIPTVFRELTVRENFEVAGFNHHGVLLNVGSRRKKIAADRIEEVTNLVNLRGKLSDRAGSLSHGETQWLELGMVLVQNPKIILLDEPSAGMTVQETLKTSQIINDLKGRHTLIVVEHDMAFVREIAEKITVMHLGKVLAEGVIQDIENNQAVKDAYLGRGGIG
ncbi:MAG: urea ABC transporter ATP-binding protein UrtD [Alphaproteobacteria bacterium]|jgi:urea transport system ATP-binding protein